MLYVVRETRKDRNNNSTNELHTDDRARLGGATGAQTESHWHVSEGGDARRSSAARLVQPALADVAHPLDDVVVAVVEFGLEHLEVAHLEARRREGNLWI